MLPLLRRSNRRFGVTYEGLKPVFNLRPNHFLPVLELPMRV